MQKNGEQRIQSVPLAAVEDARNAAPDAQKGTAVAVALSDFLASTYILYHMSLFYHWNVTGTGFVNLHQLFEEHYKELHHAGDEIAERVRAIGHFVPGTLKEFLDMSSVKEDEFLPSRPQDMVRSLLESHETCSREARSVLRTAEKYNDPVTGDLMLRRMAFHDKAAWKLRSLLS